MENQHTAVDWPNEARAADTGSGTDNSGNVGADIGKLPQPLRVLAVPAGHPYPRHILADRTTGGLEVGGSDAVCHLADPPSGGNATASTWWPPAAIDPHWVSAHRREFDLLHLHFGVESFSLDHLRDALAALRRAQRPFVYTVHDLRNPQLTDQTQHRRQLELLVSEATALITLTLGAAAEIERLFGRVASVIAHPHVVPLDVEPQSAPDAVSQMVIGLSLKDFRPNVDAVGSTATLLAAVLTLRSRGADVRVIIDHQTRVRDGAALAVVRRLAATAVDFVTVWEHPRLDDTELFTFLNALDACVLPYSHGTHSGWLELCWDLGVAVAAPRVGYLAQQHPESADIASFDAGSAESLATALTTVLEAPDAAAPGSTARFGRQASRRVRRGRERQHIAEQHLAVYRAALVAGARW